MFAAHHRLANLVAIVDVNGQQALGYTADVLDLAPLAERWRAFGWEVVEVDGHDPAALAALLPHWTPPTAPAPRALRPHGLRPGRLVHGEQDRVALPAPMTPSSTRRRSRRSRRRREAERSSGALVELAEEDPTGSSCSPATSASRSLEPFAERFPDRFFNAGVAEQNMVGVATGLAEAGFMPVRLLDRDVRLAAPYEFIRNGPVLHQLPVRVVGVGGGFDYGHERASRTTRSRTSASCASSPA